MSAAPFKTGHVERPGARRALPFRLSRHSMVRRAVESRPAAVNLLESASALGFSPYVVDQGQTGTCFACAPKFVLELNHALAGSPLPFRVSVLDIATLVHALERAEDGSPTDRLWDWGGDPADVATVVSRYGVREARYRLGTDEASRFCDASPDTVGPDHEPGEGEEGGQEESLLDFERDAQAIQAQPHELDGKGEDPVEQALDTLADKTAFTLAFNATDADMNATASDVLDGRGGQANHDVCVVGYKSTPTGYQFLLQNSWSDGWAMRGLIWVNESFIRSSTARYAAAVPPSAWKEVP